MYSFYRYVRERIDNVIFGTNTEIREFYGNFCLSGIIKEESIGTYELKK